jgi:two-component system, chemotaxis family, sensor kinase CheA
MNEDIFKKFRDKFFEEANMLLDQFEKDILELEKTPDDKELHESVFRAMHTIKGISAMYGFEHISEFTHILENIFQNMREGKILFSTEISEISLLAIDHIHNLLEDEKLLTPELRKIHKNLLQRINKTSNVETAVETIQPTKNQLSDNQTKSWYIIINANEKMYFRGISLLNIYNDLSALGTIRLHRIPVLNADNIDSWGILLVTSASIDEIYDILMFIEDDCSIIKVSDKNVLADDSGNSDQNVDYNKRNEPSILDLIESTGNISDSNPISLINEIEKQKQSIIKQRGQRISVDTIKLDDLMSLVSQLVSINSQMYASIKSKDCEKQLDYIEKLDILTKKFRNNALQIRLVPLSDIALRFQRLIRDLSNTLGKKIEYITEGIDTELDKNTIDRIIEPLMHIMRNCIDHGIEEPHLRKQSGKPETGLIKLSANYSGNYIIIRIEDDGTGIDLKKIQQKAIEKGIIKKEDKLSEQELYDIIFLPGFSTAQNLSEVSGRGVGMDIVKKRIHDLRGTIKVSSKLGVGTNFTIKLGQSMAITDTLLFMVEKTYFILPISDIESCDQLEVNEIMQRKDTSTIPYNNQLIPYIDLRKHLKLDGSYSDNAKLIIVHNNLDFLAIMADSIIGEHQSVIKPLHKTYTSESIITAVSQLGDGKIAFLIDIGILNKQISVQQLIEV